MNGATGLAWPGRCFQSVVAIRVSTDRWQCDMDRWPRHEIGKRGHPSSINRTSQSRRNSPLTVNQFTSFGPIDLRLRSVDIRFYAVDANSAERTGPSSHYITSPSTEWNAVHTCHSRLAIANLLLLGPTGPFSGHLALTTSEESGSLAFCCHPRTCPDRRKFAVLDLASRDISPSGHATHPCARPTGARFR